MAPRGERPSDGALPGLPGEGARGGFASEILAVDAHAAGEPGRVIIGGIPDVPGSIMFEKMSYLRDHVDWLRLLMLRRPPGERRDRGPHHNPALGAARPP